MWPAKGDPGFRGVSNAPMPQPWALNPAAYQNMSNEQVDWARLAQQWIMMKDSTPVAPPPPHLSLPQPAPPGSTILEEEGGEAPMDISKDEDLAHPGGETQPWNNGNNWQQPWNRHGYWPKNDGRYPPSGHDLNRGDYYSSYGMPGYNSHGFDGMTGPPGQHQMAPFIRPRHQWEGKNMKIDRRFQNAAQNAPSVVPEEEPAPVIDAAKRRTLPSWIREGLEKMEREKQKREEKEKVEQEREEAKRQRLKEEQQALLELEAEKTGIPVKSKFESDSEEENGEEQEEEEVVEKPIIVPEQMSRPRRRFHDGPEEHLNKPTWSEKPTISYEGLMMCVRRTMTELLAAVTNSEIETLGEEALRKALAKGLAIYGSESESSSSESDSEDPRSSKSRLNRGLDSDDSDEDIKETIRKKQQEFTVREREIAAVVAEAKEREQRAAVNSVKSGAEPSESMKDTSDMGHPQRQVESIKELPNADEGKNGKSAKVEKTERKQRSRSRSSSASTSSSHSSRSSRPKKRKKSEKRDQVRMRDRKKDRKRRRSSTDSRRSKSPRHRSKSPKRRNSSRDRKRRGSRDRSRTRRRRSRSSESYRKNRRRSRSRSDSSRRRRRRRSTSTSSSSPDRRARKRR